MTLELNGQKWEWELSNALSDTILLMPYWLEQILRGEEPRLVFDREHWSTDMQLFAAEGGRVRWVGIEDEDSERTLLFDVLIDRQQMVRAFYQPLREMWQRSTVDFDTQWDDTTSWDLDWAAGPHEPYPVQREALDQLFGRASAGTAKSE